MPCLLKQTLEGSLSMVPEEGLSGQGVAFGGRLFTHSLQSRVRDSG